MSTYVIESHTGEANASLLGQMGRLLMRPVRAILAAYRFRREIEQLAQMDDRMLADIGITRVDIMRAARHGRITPGSL